MELELYKKEIEFDIVALNETFLNKSLISKFQVMILLETTVQLAREEVLPSS